MNKELLIIRFNILKDRIVKHRLSCESWKLGESCYNCHRDTLTKIERLIHE